MMGRSHAVSGLAVAPGLGLHTFAEVLPFAITTGGYALVPDLDCASSTASRMLGPLTRGLGSALRWCSVTLYAATKGPRDEDGRGTHRHLTHTLAFAALLGGRVGPELLDALATSQGRIALAAGIGCFTHCLADSVTRAGCPWLFPLPIAGETWYEIRPPRFLRFRAGGPFEHAVMFPALVLASALLLPGVWPYLVHLVEHVSVR